MLLLLGLLLGWRPVAGAAPLPRERAAGTTNAVQALPLDCVAWTAVSSPNGGTADNVLNGVSGVSAADVWAVGAYTGTNGLQQTLTEHWNGSTWIQVASLNAGTGDNILHAVSARAANDVWAVGEYRPTPGANLQTLTEHWTGSAWGIVSSPNGGTLDNSLQGVVSISGTEAWAVGYYTTSLLPYHTLGLHWTGGSWSLTTLPNPGFGGALRGLSALSATDIWAVGAYASSLSTVNTLTIHWNGSAWTQVTSQSMSSLSALAAVAPISATDVWAVGIYTNTRYLTLTEHYNGSAWSIVASPSYGTGDNALGGLAARSTNDVWAVGGYGTGGGTSSTLTLHWDGTAWTPAPSDNPSNAGNALLSATVAGTDLWAVGSSGPAGALSTLAERLGSSPCATGTPTSTAVPPSATTVPPSATTVPPSATAVPPSATPPPSQTPGGLTATPVPPSATPVPPSVTPLLPSATPLPASATLPAATSTAPPATAPPATAPPATATPGAPTATASPCTASFSDVHASDYFYTPVLYLACHGVVSGYGDGTFRPYSQTTRSQQVKIVVLGFQKTITIPPNGGFTFADVPPGFPFFAVIETAAADHIVSGYACGGPGEPCDSAGRPYFRPYANVTRGQLSKIDVVAAGWPLQAPATGTFADVLPGSAFYAFVETAACHGVVSGYACGGPGEPCDPTHRPYFRPYNSATRGQIAKIVYLSVTGGPACGAAR